MVKALTKSKHHSHFFIHIFLAGLVYFFAGFLTPFAEGIVRPRFSGFVEKMHDFCRRIFRQNGKEDS